MKWLALAVLALGLAAPAAGLAQVPSVPPQLLTHVRPQSGDAVRFCVGEKSFQRDLEIALAEELAGRLLLEARIVEYKAPFPPRPYDYALSIAFEDVFLLLSNDCDAFMGLSLDVDPTSNWLATTRAIYETDFVLVGHPGTPGLGQMGRTNTVGVRLGGVGDLRLNTYLRNLPDEQRPRLVQYPEHPLLFERLQDGSLDSVLIWEPAVERLARDYDAVGSYEKLDTGAFKPPYMQFGVGLLTQNAFLRVELDKAIESAIADGTVAQLLEETGEPGRASSGRID